MNIYFINKPKKVYIESEYLHIHKAEEKFSIKISDIDNIICFNDYKLPNAVISHINKQPVYYINKEGIIVFYKQPQIKLKTIRRKHNILFAASLGNLKSINAYARIDRTIKFGIELELFHLSKKIDYMITTGMLRSDDEISLYFASEIILDTWRISKYKNLFSGLEIPLFPEKSKSRLAIYNYMFSFLTIFINHHLIKYRINPFQNIIIKTKIKNMIENTTKVGTPNYPDTSIILMFPFYITVYDLVTKNILYPGINTTDVIVLLRHFNHRFTYNI